MILLVYYYFHLLVAVASKDEAGRSREMDEWRGESTDPGGFDCEDGQGPHCQAIAMTGAAKKTLMIHSRGPHWLIKYGLVQPSLLL